MSIHKDCGEEVRWVRRDDDPDRYAPPLEFAGRYLIITENNVAMEVSTYKHHSCDPEKMNAWLDYLEKIEAIKERKGVSPDHTVNWVPDSVVARQAASQRAQEKARLEANRVACNTCKQVVGFNCLNLAEQKKGNEVFTKWPHPARVELSYKIFQENED